MHRWDVLINLIERNGYTRVVELGVWRGKTMRPLLTRFPQLHYAGVDLFAVQPDGLCETYESGENGHEWDHEAYHREAVVFTEQYPNAQILREHTVEAAKRFTDQSIDLVFIDADHSYEGVAADIQAWKGKVRSGGTIAGHDYEPSFPGVIRAVDQFYPRAHQYPDNVWAYKIP